jgi:cell division protein FtsB
MVADFNKKANREFFNKKLLFKTVGIIFLAGIFVLVIADFKIYQKKQELASQVGALQKQIEDIKKSSQTLNDEIANSDNTDYLEKIAYEQLGEQKPGEKEIIFVNPQEKQKAAASPTNFWTGWLGQCWNWISGHLFSNKSTAN